jgi:hypothetical protein
MDALHSAIVFPLICLVLIDCVAKGAVIHVAVTGNDSHNGSAATPFRTISKAAGAAQPGDIITVHEGVYRERINPPRGGTSDEVRIVYQAAPGEKVVIKGSEQVAGWTRNGTKLTGVEQASRLLFPLKAGSRDGRPTSQTGLNLVPFGCLEGHFGKQLLRRF